ncbi:MAG: site-specific DNA-methyltransferase, partial [Clostridiales Family XIII bacterium]|nr:site-specific DNA-methyltransferase [Clostridiales Family XIII bacterium]
MPILNWLGKDKVINHHQDVPFRILNRKYNFGAAGSDNMLIRGDNLDALKALLPRYEGRIKLVYIDPPYNTGNEGWVYNDNVNDPKIRKWLGEVVGKEGEDLSRHDKWLCMMYLRLRLLQRLLADDGAIFISIDDNEQANLKLICDEIFGGRNFITSLLWRKVDSPNDNKVAVTPDHEYIVAYAKNLPQLQLVQMPAPSIVDAYGQVGEDGRYYRDRLLKKNGRSSLRTDRPTMYFPLIAPDENEVYPTHDNGEEARWAMGKDGVERHQVAGTLIWKKRKRAGEEVWEPYTREFAPDNPSRPYPSIWYDLPTMRQAKALLRSIFGVTDSFDTPKPNELIERIMQMINDPTVIVLDSFAGSGTTAHAVLNMNKRDGGNRRFNLVETADYAERITATVTGQRKARAAAFPIMNLASGYCLKTATSTKIWMRRKSASTSGLPRRGQNTRRRCICQPKNPPLIIIEKPTSQTKNAVIRRTVSSGWRILIIM